MSNDSLTITQVFQEFLGEEAGRASTGQPMARRQFSRSELAKGMAEGEFAMWYQPKVASVDRSLAGAEALLRWQHPEYGLLSPDVFLTSLEESGFIQELGAWVIREVASFNKRLRDQHKNFTGRLAINVSPSQFNDSAYLSAMLRATEKFAFPNHFLEIELTERGVLNDPAGAIKLMQMIREYGISIAIDDFGTGFSSMQSLATLPVSTVKLDISFIRRMNQSSQDRTIVRSMLDLCRALNVTSVAEGVEDETQAEILTLWRCDQFQGFLFSPPLPEASFLALI